jgi:hypothetical protein
MLVSNVTALGTEFFSDLGTLSEGTVRVASRRVTGLSSTVGGVAALGSDLLELVLGQVGEVCGVGGGHCVEWWAVVGGLGGLGLVGESVCVGVAGRTNTPYMCPALTWCCLGGDEFM